MDLSQNRVTGEPFKIVRDCELLAMEVQEDFFQNTKTDLKFESAKQMGVMIRVGSRSKKKREEIINIIRKGQPLRP